MTHRTSRPLSKLVHAVREIADGMRLLWGSPVHVAAREVMTRDEHRRVAAWLGWLERTTRGLVIFLALRLIPHLRAHVSAPRQGKTGPRPREIWLSDPARPATWKARLRIPLLPLPASMSARRRIDRPRPRAFLPTSALALRYEAACRVLADPRLRARAHAFHLLRLARIEARSNVPGDLAARIVTPLAPAVRNWTHGERIAARAAKRVFNALIGGVLDLLEGGALSRRRLEPG